MSDKTIAVSVAAAMLFLFGLAVMIGHAGMKVVTSRPSLIEVADGLEIAAGVIRSVASPTPTPSLGDELLTNSVDTVIDK